MSLGTMVFWLVLVGLDGIHHNVGAGFCQCIATNPMEITKIRMQVQATLPKEERVGLWQGGLLSFPLTCSLQGFGYLRHVQGFHNYIVA